MQVKSIGECSKHSAILLTFIKQPFVIKIFVLSIFEWLFYTGFTVLHFITADPFITLTNINDKVQPPVKFETAKKYSAIIS